jgi:hypothetical protein
MSGRRLSGSHRLGVAGRARGQGVGHDVRREVKSMRQIVLKPQSLERKDRRTSVYYGK